MSPGLFTGIGTVCSLLPTGVEEEEEPEELEDDDDEMEAVSDDCSP